MKFIKQKDFYYHSRYIREDGKFVITSINQRKNGRYKRVYEVTDHYGYVIDTMELLEDAMIKYGLI